MKSAIVLLVMLSVSLKAQKKDSLLIDNVKNANDAARLSMVNDQINSQAGGTYHGTIQAFDTRYQGVKGTYYLIPIWLEGDLYGNAGKLVASRVSIKYDALNKEVIQRNTEKDTIAVYPSAFTLYDQINSYQFVHRSGFTTTSGKKIPNTYLQVLFLNRIGFYKNFTKSLLPADYKQPYSDNRPYDSFEEKTEYFLANEKGEIEQIKLNQKSLLQTLQDQKKALEIYIKTNQLDLRREEDVVSLLAYYESLSAKE
jgi:hypothetical protein